MTAAVVTALSPWFGSKRTLAPRIVAELGPHNLYFEAFCASMAVLIAKPPSPMEVVCDLHGDLVNMARVIQHPTLGAAFYRRCRRLLCSQEQFLDVKPVCDGREREAAPQEPDVERAVQFFLFSWIGRNGTVGSNSGNHFCVRYTANGGSPAKRLASAVESIPAWRRRLRNVIILNENSFDVLDRIDDEKTTAIYADPPYMVKGSKYLHDFTPADHERLAGILRGFKRARICVSYYEHPEVRRLYQGWTFVNCETTKAMVSAGQRGKGAAVKAPELLIINGPSYTQPSEGALFE